MFLPEAIEFIVATAAETTDCAEMVAAGMMTGTIGGSGVLAGMDTEAGILIEVTYPLMVIGKTLPISSDIISCTDCGIFPAISVIWLAGAVKTMVVVTICGGPLMVTGSGSRTTAVVTMPPKVRVMVVLCATMRLGNSATAKRAAEVMDRIFR